MDLASGTVHVATDWTALGVFFVMFAAMLGGFARFILGRIDKNRDDWKQFVQDRVNAAMAELASKLEQQNAQVSALTGTVDKNSAEITDQGKAIARIEGALSSRALPQPGPL